MKRLYRKLLDSLNINGRDFAVFLLALLLAFSIWLIHNLSLRYNDYLTVGVVAHCNIDGHSEVSANRTEVIARCRTTGYNVINSDLRGRRRVVDIEFKPSEMRHKEGDMFYVLSSDLQEYAHIFFGDDVNVEYFVSDTLFFRFPYEEHKRVPVHPMYSISYRTQYMSDGELEFEPDTVTIYGDPYRLENIDKVYTEPIKYSDLTEDVQGVASIEKIKGVRISATEIHYSLDVTRYVEVKTSVPVKAVNVPARKEMLVYPSNVEVTLKCVFPLLSDPLEGLDFQVDYTEFQSSISGKCTVKPASLPRGVIGYDISPAVVGCFIEE